MHDHGSVLLSHSENIVTRTDFQQRYFPLSLLTMVNRMHVGQKLEDFSPFESAIRHYQNAENAVLQAIFYCSAAQSLLSNKKLDEKLKYYEIPLYKRRKVS